MARLSKDERNFYARQGYVVPAWRFPKKKIDEMRGALDRLIADNPGVRPEKLVSAHLENGKEGVKGSRDFLELAREPELVELIADAIGGDVILWGCQVFCKPGGDGLETPFHQDGHYWPIRPLATCTAWVALDPSTRQNGCLKVVPGSHSEKKLFSHLTEDRQDLVLTQRIQDPGFDEAKAVAIELEPGQMSLHDIYMIHGATVNRSPQRRAGVAIRYMPGSSVFLRDLIKPNSSSGYLVDFASRPLWLLKGKDRTGKNDFSIGH
ncbi:MAG TPA: phytanoyl-CoA dioxygenase family protein [Burkholderiales bacterium]|nr:phytanoyl-CoA dioxygenase family protein [Burkholderiales bacterium]